MRHPFTRALAITAVTAAFAALGPPVHAHIRSGGCPAALPPEPAAAQGVLSAVARSVPRLYSQPDHRNYQVTALTSLAPRAFVPTGISPYRGIALRRCGARVVNRSWLVFLYFPKLAPSASLAEGIVYAARTRAGWTVWYRYR